MAQALSNATALALRLPICFRGLGLSPHCPPYCFCSSSFNILHGNPSYFQLDKSVDSSAWRTRLSEPVVHVLVVRLAGPTVRHYPHALCPLCLAWITLPWQCTYLCPPIELQFNFNKISISQIIQATSQMLESNAHATSGFPADRID